MKFFRFRIKKKRMTLIKPIGAIRVFGRSLWVLGIAFVGVALVTDAFEQGGEILRNALLSVTGVVFAYGLFSAFVGAWANAFEAVKGKRLLKQCETEPVWEVVEQREGQRGGLLRVLRGVNEQYRVDPNSVDETVLIGLLKSRMNIVADRIEHCGRICLQCGMIGTVGGLMLMLPAMGKAVTAAEGKGGPDLMVEMFKEGGPLGDLGTAFLTTLAGIVASVILSGLSASHRQSVKQVCASFLESMNVYVMPAFRRAGKKKESMRDERFGIPQRGRAGSNGRIKHDDERSSDGGVGRHLTDSHDRNGDDRCT